jgi:hypothetical protein
MATKFGVRIGCVSCGPRHKVIEGVSGTLWYVRWKPDARRRDGGEWVLVGVVDAETNSVHLFSEDMK